VSAETARAERIFQIVAERNRLRDALQEIAVLTTDYDDFQPEYERVNAIARGALKGGPNA
jgi:hypothetical protein